LRSSTHLLSLLLTLTCLTLGCQEEGSTSDATQPPNNDASGDVAVAIVPCIQSVQACGEKQQGCAVNATTGEEECQPCQDTEMPDAEGICEPIAGTMHAYDFGELTLEGGGEYNGVCQSWILNNSEELWVNAVEFSSQGFYHHSNWFFIPEGTHDYKDGNWYDCYNEGFEEITTALKGGVLFAQSTQVNREVQRFGEGVALRIPPYARIIAATHLLNYTPDEVTTSLTLRLYTLATDKVKVKLTPFRLSYFPLDIPPKATSEFAASCDIDAAFQNAGKKPLDMKLHYVLPHYHTLGHNFRIGINGGERDGETLYELGTFTADPFGKVFDPPIDLAGAKGLDFSCTFLNPRDEAVGWGIGDQEMCLMLGFAESTIAFDASVQENEVVGPDADGVVQNTGSCGVAGFPFSQQKPGGTPPE
jgi:hypothetical protein